MVANNRFGRSMRSLSILALRSVDPLMVSFSFGPNEKKATSEPETRAEQSSKNRIATDTKMMVSNSA